MNYPFPKTSENITVEFVKKNDLLLSTFLTLADPLFPSMTQTIHYQIYQVYTLLDINFCPRRTKNIQKNTRPRPKKGAGSFQVFNFHIFPTIFLEKKNIFRAKRPNYLMSAKALPQECLPVFARRIFWTRIFCSKKTCRNAGVVVVLFYSFSKNKSWKWANCCIER